MGKTKTPVGLERLQSSASTEQVENGFPSELAPGRDVGVQLQGEFASGGTSYALGVYNGAPDGRDGLTSNPDNDFELAGRLFFEPWKNAANGLSGLGFGIAGSTGDKDGPRQQLPAALPHARTGAVLRLSQRRPRRRRTHPLVAAGLFLPRTIRAPGRIHHLLPAPASPRPAASSAIHGQPGLAAQRWRGPDRRGQQLPRRGPSEPSLYNRWRQAGARFELVARYGRLDIDDDAFPLFADPATAAARRPAAGAWASTGTSPATSSSSPTTTQTAFDAARRRAASAKTKKLS